MMHTLLKIVGEFRLRYLATLVLVFLVINAILRVTLQIAFSTTLPLSPSLFYGLLIGALNDCAALVFALLLPSTLILLPSNTFLQRSWGKIYSTVIIFIFATVFIFTAFAEFFFWQEFGCRFNFIAVDYLIYTTELMRNIIESYPLVWLLLAVFFLAAVTTFLLWKRLCRYIPRTGEFPEDHFQENASRSGRLTMLGSLYLSAILVFFLFIPFGAGQNRFWNEYAKNGTYELFSAYQHNELDYRAFYKTMDRQKAFNMMRSEIQDAGAIFEPVKGENLVRMVDATGPELKPNVIIVIMESMGSAWLGEHTPYLNALTDNGLSFTNMMSTGTRTVRGIEAVMLSVPPTPGNSIVRRPENGGLFSLGTPFSQRGYWLDFIYGGIGYFDNMNAFFRGNGFHVTDRLDFAKQNTTFSNAWGQCDEDLYAESIRLADKRFEAGKAFLQVLLTTSNHRPFTFPSGKIRMQPGSRRAAVQYADFAVGKFMREAREKPWFDNTVFVFVGDHPSSIAGKTEVPADAYGVVCSFYGPGFFRHEKIETLCSQIDIAPTLLASLNWEYRSPFFGTDARKLPPESGRAWVSTYQLLGFRTKDRLVVLKPDASAEVARLEPLSTGVTHGGTGAHEDDALITRTVASYQCAYDYVHPKEDETKCRCCLHAPVETRP